MPIPPLQKNEEAKIRKWMKKLQPSYNDVEMWTMKGGKQRRNVFIRRNSSIHKWNYRQTTCEIDSRDWADPKIRIFL